VLAVHFPHWVSPVAKRFVEHPGLVEVLTGSPVPTSPTGTAA
jgi:hypothetical protein